MSGYPGMRPKYIKHMEDEKILNTVKNRFYRNVLMPNENGCMEWIGSFRSKKRKLSYGVIHSYKPNHSAHRLSYEIWYGKIQDGFIVCHKCDNPKCVSPEHLFLGTHKDNSRDMVKKSRNNLDQNGEKNSQYKITDKIKKNIIHDLKNGITGKEISKKYNISEASVTKIKNKGNTRKKQLKSNQVKEIRLLLNNNIIYTDIAKKYGIGIMTISNIKHNKIWRNV